MFRDIRIVTLHPILLHWFRIRTSYSSKKKKWKARVPFSKITKHVIKEKVSFTRLNFRRRRLSKTGLFNKEKILEYTFVWKHWQRMLERSTILSTSNTKHRSRLFRGKMKTKRCTIFVEEKISITKDRRCNKGKILECFVMLQFHVRTWHTCAHLYIYIFTRCPLSRDFEVQSGFVQLLVA